MNIIIFILILLVLVLVHEFGHFYSAKKFGIRVDEFGFGFPPKLFSKKFGETEYSLNLLPIGGFVKIFGENPDDENTNGPDRERSFVHKAKWKQAVVLFAGVFMNFLLAWVLFSFGFMSGLPTSVAGESKGYTVYDVHTVVVSVLPKSPAELAGIQSGDKIFSVKNDSYSPSNINPDTVKSVVVGAKDGIELGYTRGSNNNVNYVKIIPTIAAAGAPSIGIAMDQIGVAKLGFFSSIVEGAKLTVAVTKGTTLGLYHLIADAVRGKGSFASVTGPVGMVGIVGDASRFGFVYLMSFAALISVNLAIINLLPFPALDGGRLFFLLIEKIKGSRINPKFANNANMVGFGILILLMVVVTFHDIIKLF